MRPHCANGKNGTLIIFDIASAEIVQEVTDAHEGEIWQIKKHKVKFISLKFITMKKANFLFRVTGQQWEQMEI